MTKYLSLATCWLLVTAGTALASPSMVIRVGSDATCDVGSLSAAIAQLPASAPGGIPVIRVALNATYDQPVQLVDRSVVIEGGYLNCSDPAPFPGAETTLGPMPTAATRMLDIVASPGAGPVVVRLRGLEFSGPAPLGALRATGAVDLHLEGTDVVNAGTPQLPAGGAVHLRSGATLWLGSDDRIAGNQACRGAGIAAEFSTVMLGAGVVIDSNAAACQGGGLALLASDAVLRDDAGLEVRISDNVAPAGGGIHAVGSRVVHATPSGAGRLRMVANGAERGGAVTLRSSVFDLSDARFAHNGALASPGAETSGSCGVFDADQGSLLRLRSPAIELNAADRSGGVFCVLGGSEATVSGHGPDCIRPGDAGCPLITGNAAQVGGVAWVSGAGRLDLSPSVLFTNSAETGALVRVESAPGDQGTSRVRLVDAVAANNRSGEPGELISAAGGRVEIHRSTLADNFGVTSIVDGTPQEIVLSGNWFADTAPTRVIGPAIQAAVLSTCNGVRPGETSADPTGASLLPAVPTFIDRARGDYRVRLAPGDEPAGIDRCHGPIPPGLDLGGRPRVVDFGAPGGVPGLMDLGAFEAQPSDILSDVLFVDGLEPLASR